MRLTASRLHKAAESRSNDDAGSAPSGNGRLVADGAAGKREPPALLTTPIPVPRRASMVSNVERRGPSVFKSSCTAVAFPRRRDFRGDSLRTSARRSSCRHLVPASRRAPTDHGTDAAAAPSRERSRSRPPACRGNYAGRSNASRSAFPAARLREPVRSGRTLRRRNQIDVTAFGAPRLDLPSIHPHLERGGQPSGRLA